MWGFVVDFFVFIRKTKSVFKNLWQNENAKLYLEVVFNAIKYPRRVMYW